MVFPQAVSWPPEPLSALGQGPWDSHGLAHIRPLSSASCCQGQRRDRTSPAPGSSQTPGQQMSHQRQDLKGHGRDGQLLCCGIIVTAVIFCRPTVSV